jgi:hypothetical protein
MKKKLTTVAVLMLAATQANALSGAREQLSHTVNNSYSQAYWYIACVGKQLSNAYDLFYGFF